MKKNNKVTIILAAVLAGLMIFGSLAAVLQMLL